MKIEQLVEKYLGEDGIQKQLLNIMKKAKNNTNTQLEIFFNAMKKNDEEKSEMIKFRNQIKEVMKYMIDTIDDIENPIDE